MPGLDSSLRWTFSWVFPVAAMALALPGAFAGLGLADRGGGLAGDGGQVPVALLGSGSSRPLAGLVVQRRLPGPGGQVPAGAKAGHAGAGSGDRGGPSRAST